MATIWLNGVPQTVTAGTRLSEVLSRAPHPCGGKGICGKCRVRATGALSPLSAEEERHLTPFEIADGVRLSCCTVVEGDCRVTLSADTVMAVVTDGKAAVNAAEAAFAAYGVAVDIGTTTVAARLYNTAGHLLAQEGCPNPQTAFGADVLSRIQAAGEGWDLTAPLRYVVNGLITRLSATAGISPAAIDGAVITGNTAMLCFLSGTDPTSLSRAPFSLPRPFDETVTAAGIGLTALAPNRPVYLPPCASAFIGADALCAALACDVGDERTAMLLDMGTNGEMLLAHQGRLYACSTAAGPAFEGVGISCGLPAVAGAIDAVTSLGGGYLPHVIGGGHAAGICGSGLVDAAACLLAMEEMDDSGSLGVAAVALCDGVYLTQADIRALQQAKAAVCAGMHTLLRRAALTAAAVEVLYTAGGFGSRLNRRSATAIGLLPQGLTARIEPVGNAALDGAAHLLLDVSARGQVTALAEKMHVIELATDPDFADLFIKNMSF
ncbi:MAG: DUF4445 domain-containing protein [Clostridia bacterium]|nr:DUF4445 domain-containing protein [Clostridia bacterium]